MDRFMVLDSVNPFGRSAVPQDVVTDTVPPPFGGTIALIAEGLLTVKEAAGIVLKATWDTPVNPLPLMSTRLEGGPAAGVTELIVGPAWVEIVRLFEVTLAETDPVWKIIFGLLDPVAVPVV